MGSLVAARGLFAVVRGLLSSCGTWAPEHLGSVIAERGLSCLRGMSSPTRDRTRVPCIGRRIFFFFRGVPLLLFFIIYLFIHLFLVVLGLRFCARAFSSCGKQGPPFIAVRGPLTIVASLVAEHKLQTCRLSSYGSRA